MFLENKQLTLLLYPQIDKAVFMAFLVQPFFFNRFAVCSLNMGLMDLNLTLVISNEIHKANSLLRVSS